MSGSLLDKIVNEEEETKMKSTLEFSSISTEKYQNFGSSENIGNNGSNKEEITSDLSYNDANELKRCIDIAEKSLKRKDFSKSITFLIKACKIHPSPENYKLLNNAKEMKEAHEREIKEKEELAKKKAEEKRKLNEESQRLCKQILKSQNVYEALNIEKNESYEDIKKHIRNALLKIHPDKTKGVLSLDDSTEASKLLNKYKTEVDDKIMRVSLGIKPQIGATNQLLSIEDEKSEESVDELSISDDSECSEEEAEFEEVPKKKKKKKSDWSDLKPYLDFDNFILNFRSEDLQSTPTTKVISDEFDDLDQYISEFKAAFFLEVHEIIKKEINDVKMSNVYTLILEEDGKRGYKISPSNGDLCREFYSEIHANDLLLMYPHRESKVININGFCLGIARKGHKTGSTWIQAIQNTRFELEFDIICLGNLTTLRREYLTFVKLEDSLLLDYILFPKPPRASSTPIVSERFLKTISNKYNPSQLDVLNHAFRVTEGLLLVQGPPGTGKTSTILGLISGYLSIDPITRPKILICAPSNAAVDELASRAHISGFFDENGDRLEDVTMLRVGQKRLKNELGIVNNLNIKDIPANIKEFSFNYLMEAAMEIEGLRDPSDVIKVKLEEITSLRRRIKDIINSDNGDFSLLTGLKQRRDELQIELNQLFEEKNTYIERQKSLRRDCIENADIVFCTTSTAGSLDMLNAFASNDDEIALRKFDYLIIDEACQSVELSILIPFLYDTSTVVLVGDPKQLPATTFADGSRENKYNRSLFERIIDCNFKPLMLKIQYRMITELCEYPSMYIYDHMLKSDPKVNQRQMPPGIKYRGLWFFNLIDSKEGKERGGHSYFNKTEANFIVNELINEKGMSIGIITPYKAQVEEIKRLLRNRFGESWRHRIEVDSVDGYQGREKDFIILSLVRSKAVGFLRDTRRMNVAITRARFALNIVGNASCLKKNEDWDDLIDYCKDKDKLFYIDYGRPNSGWKNLLNKRINKKNKNKEKPKNSITVSQDSKYLMIEEEKSSNGITNEIPQIEYKEVIIDAQPKKWRKKENKQIKSSNKVAEEILKLEYNKVSADSGPKKWKKKEKKQIEETEIFLNETNINVISIYQPIFSNETNTNAISIYQPIEERQKAKEEEEEENENENENEKEEEKTISYPKADKMASKMSNKSLKKIPKIKNAYTGEGFRKNKQKIFE